MVDSHAFDFDVLTQNQILKLSVVISEEAAAALSAAINHQLSTLNFPQ
jgi:hypothetical protein